MKATVSAPGSIVLPDRTALERGLPGLLLACSERVYVSITKAERASVQASRHKAFVSKILDGFSEKFNDQKDTNWAVSINSSFFDEAAFGFLPAVTVALVGALMYTTRGLWNPLAIHKNAYEILKPYNNYADAECTVATFGGVLWYRRELSYLTSLWQLPVKIKPAMQKFFVRAVTSAKIQRTRESAVENEGWVKRFAEVLKKEDVNEVSRVMKQRGEITLKSKGNKEWHLCFGKIDNRTTIRTIQLGEEGIRLEKGNPYENNRRPE